MSRQGMVLCLYDYRIHLHINDKSYTQDSACENNLDCNCIYYDL